MTLLLFLACQPSEPGDDSGDPVVPDVELPGVTMTGDLPRATPSEDGVPALRTSNTDFTLDLHRLLLAAAPDENLVWSPWSLQVAMGQVYAGAEGASKDAIASTFRWTLEDDALHEAFNATGLAVDAHHDLAAEPPVAVTSTSQVFVTEGYPLGEPWLDTLSENYGTSVQQMDFASDPGGVAADINAWISARTGGHIDKLITEPMVASSRMLLVNALYFAASWYVPFSESVTTDLPFTMLDGSTPDVPTMAGAVNLSGGYGDGFLVAELPYSDHGLVMTLVVPDAGRFGEIASTLEWTAVQAVLDQSVACDECPVQLPKFEVESAPPIEDALIAQGMEDAFGGAYPGINEALTMTGIAQNGFVSVSEKGTEAAAATVVEFSDSASIPTLDDVFVDRPFLWFVREVDTGAILFAGHVVDPR